MKNFKWVIDYVRSRVEVKQATLKDYILHAMARAARNAENEGEANYLTTKYILKLATPLKSRNKINCNANGDPYFTVRQALLQMFYSKYSIVVWGKLDAEDRLYVSEKAKTLLDMFERQYLYIFVRQDISPEYQAVQTAHATFVAGARLAQDDVKFDPAKTHFVLIGVPDLNALYEARGLAEAAGVGTHSFYEEDLDNQLTAFTTGIVQQDNRHHFKQFNLLKFNQEVM